MPNFIRWLMREYAWTRQAHPHNAASTSAAWLPTHFPRGWRPGKWETRGKCNHQARPRRPHVRSSKNAGRRVSSCARCYEALRCTTVQQSFKICARPCWPVHTPVHVCTIYTHHSNVGAMLMKDVALKNAPACTSPSALRHHMCTRCFHSRKGAHSCTP